MGFIPKGQATETKFHTDQDMEAPSLIATTFLSPDLLRRTPYYVLVNEEKSLNRLGMISGIGEYLVFGPTELKKSHNSSGSKMVSAVEQFYSACADRFSGLAGIYINHSLHIHPLQTTVDEHMVMLGRSCATSSVFPFRAFHGFQQKDAPKNWKSDAFVL